MPAFWIQSIYLLCRHQWEVLVVVLLWNQPSGQDYTVLNRQVSAVKDSLSWPCLVTPSQSFVSWLRHMTQNSHISACMTVLHFIYISFHMPCLRMTDAMCLLGPSKEIGSRSGILGSLINFAEWLWHLAKSWLRTWKFMNEWVKWVPGIRMRPLVYVLQSTSDAKIKTDRI